MRNVQAAASRFFRFYMAHCESPGPDTLFSLLNSAHSLNDRLNRDLGANFFDADEFIAVKALRNLLHHANELLSKVKVIPIQPDMPISSDLITMCLVPRDMVVKSIAEERRPENRPRIERVLTFYGETVNINPAIFNFGVHVFEKLNALEVPVDGEAWERFSDSYKFEKIEGHSHFVSGEIQCRAGDVDAIIDEIYISSV